jgi:serine/threonine protein kinase/Flp pilus assembly protein TadD
MALPTETIGTWSLASESAISNNREAASEFEKGDIVANRYRILQRIGAGGMGAVYRVLDLTLDRVVALKTVHPEMAHRPGALEHFKKELILARQVTHKNVCRVFDLGQERGTYFLTMEFVQGQSLGKITRRNLKCPPQEAAQIILQAAEGLEAAHETGIVHRDLKPDNIMTHADGRVLVMDFGIARPVDELGPGFAGTPAYASPEQLLGRPQDHRSDLFSLGLIFYELLCGQPAFSSPKSIEDARARASEPAPVILDRDAGLPKELCAIVERCLANQPEDRFASAKELAAAINAWLHPKPFYAKPAFTWSATAAIAALTISAAIWTNRPPPPPPAPVSLLVADFNNQTLDPLFDGTLEPAIQVALEGASFITAYDRPNAKKLIAQLRPNQPKLDAEGARLIAAREGISAVLTGSIEREDSRYRISLRTISPADGMDLAPEQRQTVARDQILNAVAKLVTPVRRALGDRTPASEQIAAAETVTAASLEAAKKYSEAQELASNPARRQEAMEVYKQAIGLDPDMGRAYSGLAAVNRNLGNFTEALKYYDLANSHIARMSERERLRTLGGYYVTANNPAKAVETFSALVQKFPADTGGHSNLALALLLQRQPARALEEGRRSVEIYPKNLSFRNNVALYALYAGDYKTAAREASSVLDENPKVVAAYDVMALSALAQEDPASAKDWYQKLEGIDASTATTGLADLAVFEGRLEDAAKILRDGIEANEAAKQTDPAAQKYADLAQVYVRLNRMTEAVGAAKHAEEGTINVGSLTKAALAYIDAGAFDRAEELAAAFRAKIGDGNQATALLIDGYAQLIRGKVEAIATLGKSKETLDTWLSHLFLGRANLVAGDYPGAYNEFQECLKRSGEASAVFVDDVPSARLLPLVWYYLGEAEEGLKSGTAKESFQHFLKLQVAQTRDPLAIAARAKIGEARSSR